MHQCHALHTLLLQGEPGETIRNAGDPNALASYELSVWGLAPGARYTTYRMQGTLTGGPGWHQFNCRAVARRLYFASGLH